MNCKDSNSPRPPPTVFYRVFLGRPQYYTIKSNQGHLKRLSRHVGFHDDYCSMYPSTMYIHIYRNRRMRSNGIEVTPNGRLFVGFLGMLVQIPQGRLQRSVNAFKTRIVFTHTTCSSALHTRFASSDLLRDCSIERLYF
jgi:hypothetical protein